MTTTVELEPVVEFQERARVWLAENLEPARAYEVDGDDEVWLRARELQKKLFAGGFAGICFPTEYGGLGLTPAHQKAFNEVAKSYEMPTSLNIPTFAICAATLLDMGSEEQKQTYLPRIISGDDVWIQFLSEPKGGSDLAGVITRAERDGDEWVINGSKIWSTGAYAADYGLCLTRSDWDVPKHAGLTMFVMPINAPGVEIKRIKLVSGSTEFCQAFFDDVRLPADAFVGEVGEGWKTASQQLFHERNSMGGGSPYISGARYGGRPEGPNLVDVARRTGQLDNALVRDRLAQARVLKVVSEQLVDRVSGGIRAGTLPLTSSSLMRLFEAERHWYDADLGVQIAGATGVTGTSPTDQGFGALGQTFLSRQAASLGGGSTEMARNIISERILDMPREFAADKGVPYSQVKNSSS